MKPEQRQLELERHYAIIQATLDYIDNCLEQGAPQDILAFIREPNLRHRAQAEKYFKQRRLDRLKRQLESFTRVIQMRCDLDFGSHIKEKTGYDIDIFEVLCNRVHKILAKKEVYKKQDHNDINALARYYRKTLGNEGVAEKLKALLLDYSKMDTSKTRIPKNDIFFQVFPEVK